MEDVETIASREMHDGRFSMPRNFVLLTTFALTDPELNVMPHARPDNLVV